MWFKMKAFLNAYFQEHNDDEVADGTLNAFTTALENGCDPNSNRSTET